MGKNNMFGATLGGVAVAMLMPVAAMGQTSGDLDRVSANEKGSLLMWSKFQLAWTSGYGSDDPVDMLEQDTILTFSNDYPSSVDVQFYVVSSEFVENGDGGYDQYWRNFDIGITLTGNQPAWWSMANGGGTFAGMPSVADHFAMQFDMDTGMDVIEGYVYAWAVGASDGSENLEITHNHLSGTATIIDYGDGNAWEYNAWTAARATDAGAGDASLNLDGTEYDTCFSHLLINFVAQTDGSNCFGGNSVDTDLALHIVDSNLDADVPGAGSYKTKAHFDVWNEYEIKLSGQYRCIYCFDNTFISSYNQGAGQGGPNHMTEDNLGTPFGKARIASVSDTLLCDGNGVDGEYAMLGVAAKIIGNEDPAGGNLVGMGERAAVITYPALDEPPVAPEGPAAAIEGLLSGLKKAARSTK